MDHPIIAITGPERGAVGPRTLVSLAVRFYGARPLHLRPSHIDHHTRDYHGVIITGGHDVNPVLYAAEPEVEPRYDEARDRLETSVIDDALARGLPLLGICRGAQLLNVRLGGSLFQELKSRRIKTSNRWTVLPFKTLNVEHNTRLATIMGAGRCRINSLHNQAINITGRGLRISGTDLDGITQAIEDREREALLLGVQWHPEFLLFMHRHRALFRALVNSAREKSAVTSTPQEKPMS